MSNTTKLLERILSGGCNMGWISDAEAEEIRALAAPVASAAPSGEREKFEAAMRAKFAPMDAGDLRWDGEKFASKFTQLAFDMWNARAAIAHQPPKEALTDEQISELAAEHLTAYQYASGARYDGEVEFARAIIAATAPNKQLVEALRETLRQAEGWYDECRGADASGLEWHKAAVAALAAAGAQP